MEADEMTKEKKFEKRIFSAYLGEILYEWLIEQRYSDGSVLARTFKFERNFQISWKYHSIFGWCKES